MSEQQIEQSTEKKYPTRSKLTYYKIFALRKKSYLIIGIWIWNFISREIYKVTKTWTFEFQTTFDFRVTLL